MIKTQELHVFEESNHLFWGLAILVCTAIGTYLLSGTFLTMDWNFFKLRQVAAILLFIISFYGIFRISEPLYHFTLHFEDRILVIEIQKGELAVDTIRIPVDEIETLKFAPHFQREKDEALFDFSPSYHLLYRKDEKEGFEKLLGVQASSITLKVNDIADIMRFITERNPDIEIPREQASYFNL